MKMKKYSYILVLILVLVIGINGVFAAETTTCEALFGSPSDPESLRYFVNKILVYPKVLELLNIDKIRDLCDIQDYNQSHFYQR